MSLNIDGIKRNVGVAYQTVSTTLSDWMGRSIARIQSGTQAAKPYLQDKKIAVISLIAVTALLNEIGHLLDHLFNKHLPNNRLTRVIGNAVILSVIGGGVVGFVKYAQLPVTPLAVLGISFGTIFVCG